MTTFKLEGELNAKSVLRKSTAGYEFDETSDEWMLDGSIQLKLNIFSELGLEQKAFAGFRKSLSRYAQELSSCHCQNIYYRILHFFRTTGVKEFSAEALSSYRAGLDDEHIWYLGVIRGFLDSWSEYGFPGISRKTINYLEGLTIKGNGKGVAVLTNCPYSGPYTSQEHLSLLCGLANAYESRELSQEGYSFLLAVSMTGRRPVQIRHLKLCDLGFTDKEGSRSYHLDIPRAKQRGQSVFRKEFKRVTICKDLYDALSDQRNDVISWVRRNLECENDDMESLLPLFPEHSRLEECAVTEILSYLNTDYLHKTSDSVLSLRKKLNTVVIAHSERTRERLIIGFTRLRRTFASNLAAEGFGPLVLAEALDHSDTQQVPVYARPENETAKVVDEVMARVLAPLAMAFAGKLVDSERDAVRGSDPHSRVKLKTETSIGNCGSFQFCADGWKGCYLCKSFQPWLDGPHQSALDELLKERQIQKDANVSQIIIGASDRVLLAITQVIQMCAARKAELQVKEGANSYE